MSVSTPRKRARAYESSDDESYTSGPNSVKSAFALDRTNSHRNKKLRVAQLAADSVAGPASSLPTPAIPNNRPLTTRLHPKTGLITPPLPESLASSSKAVDASPLLVDGSLVGPYSSDNSVTGLTSRIYRTLEGLSPSKLVARRAGSLA